MSSSKGSRENRSAQRFGINVPVRLKAESGQEVLYSTRDISHRGIFVLTDHPLPENSPIQFTMKLKSAGAPEEGIQVLCSGTVVRVEAPEGANIGMAATIDSYRFLHTKKANA